MSQVSGTIHRLAVILFAVLCICNYFLKTILLEYLCAVLLLALVIKSMPKLAKPLKILAPCFFLAGCILLVISRSDLRTWVLAFLRNANLLSMLICVPMISMPFYYKDYQNELKVLAQTKMQSIFGFCLLVNVFSHIIGILFATGGIAITFELFKPQSKLYRSDDTYITTVMRGYSSSGFWSPAWASMALVTSVLMVSWLSLIPIGLVFALIFISMDLVTVAWKIKRKPGDFPRLEAQEGTSPNWRMLSVMLILALAMIGSLILGNLATPWELLIVIPIVAAVFPIIVGVVQNHIPEYKKGMSDYYFNSLPKLHSQFAVFTAAGFFGKALDAAGVGDAIPGLLPAWLSSYPALIVAALLLLFILPALIGVHPVATGTALVAAVAPAAIGIDVMTYSMTILMGWILGTFLSPMTITSLVISGCTGRPPWSFLRLNYKFGIVALVLFSFLISVTGPLLG